MARRLRCVSLTGRNGHARFVAPWRRAILNSTIGKSYRLHNTSKPFSYSNDECRTELFRHSSFLRQRFVSLPQHYIKQRVRMAASRLL